MHWSRWIGFAMGVAVPTVSWAQSLFQPTVAAGVALEYVPAKSHAFGLRAHVSVPVAVGPECTLLSAGCASLRALVAPEIGVGWLGREGGHLDFALGAGLATVQMHTVGWTPFVQVVPQIGFRANFREPVKTWIGGFVSKSLNDRFFDSGDLAFGAADSTSGRIDLHLPIIGDDFGPLHLRIGGQFRLMAAQDYPL